MRSLRAALVRAYLSLHFFAAAAFLAVVFMKVRHFRLARIPGCARRGRCDLASLSHRSCE